MILTLTRWDASLPPRPYNLVLMMQNEAQKLCDVGHSVFPVEVRERIEERLRWAKEACSNSWETFDHTGGKQPCEIVYKPVNTADNSKSGAAAVGLCGAGAELPYVVMCTSVLAFMIGYGTSRLIKS